MASLPRLALLALCLNLYLYIAISLTSSLPDPNYSEYMLNDQLKFHFNNDIVEQWIKQDQMDQMLNNTRNNWTSYDINFTGGVNNLPTRVGGSFGGIATFIDVVDSVWGWIALFGNIVTAPLTLFFSYRMPSIIGLMIGLPYAVMMMITIVFFVRGLNS